MSEAAIMDWLLTFFIIAGIFFLFYTAYRQQGLIETVNELKEIFQGKAEDAKDAIQNGVYK